MNEIYKVLLNGRPYMKDSGVRTYKTRERAKKETERWLRTGYTVEICEYKLVNTFAVQAHKKEDE